MQRRDFLLGGMAGVGALGALSVVASGARDEMDGTSSTPQTAAPAAGAPLDAEAGPSVRRYGDQEYRQGTATPGAPNVLFISLDDQNDWLGFLNAHPGTHTPNLDRLAAESVNFTHAYAPAPMCLPSRTALFYGRPPHETGIYDHGDESRAAHEAFTPVTTSLLDDFWVAGYDVYGTGKLLNFEDADRYTSYATAQQWLPGPDRDTPEAKPNTYREDWISPYDGQPIGRGERFQGADIDFGPSGVPIDAEFATLTTNWIREQLAAPHDRPFFLAHGLATTHDPWRVPQEFFDLHPLDEIVTPELEDLEGLPEYARTQIIDTFGAFDRLLASGQWPAAVQAYQAATSFADFCVGQLLDDLAASPYADNTIVVVWSDNGFHVGEKRHLHKFTLWERSVRVPVLMKAPGKLVPQAFETPVSLMDVGPTLAGLAGVEILSKDHEGQNLLGAIADPTVAVNAPIQTWRAGNHAVRRAEWRYIRYEDGSTELYDVVADPKELANLSGLPERASLEAELDALLPTSG